MVLKEGSAAISERLCFQDSFTNRTIFAFSRYLSSSLYFLTNIGEFFYFFETNILEENNKLKSLRILEKNWVLKTIKIVVIYLFMTLWSLF